MAAYQSSSDAATLAATMLPTMIAAFLAASTGDQDAAREQGADDIDSQPIQGRRYVPSQAREFPRIADAGGRPTAWSLGAPAAYDPRAILVTPTIWDLDADGKTPIIPLAVRKAEIFQANFRLIPGATRIINARRQGLAAQSVGDMAESYIAPVGPSEWGAILCLDAYEQMKKYMLTSGGM